MIRRLSFITLLLCLTLTGMSVVCGQTWEVWGTTPVFDDGRIKPMNSFAQQIVKDICGTSRPFLVIDDSVMLELNRAAAAKLPVEEPEVASATPSQTQPFLIEKKQSPWDFGDVDDKFTEEDVAELDQTLKLTPSEADRIIQRIRALIPETGRYFDANELLLSWIGEPEVWNYIPIFYVPQSDYRDEILRIPDRNKSKIVLRRVSVFQLQQSRLFSQRLEQIFKQRRLEGMERRRTVPFDDITMKLYGAWMLFEELTFDPRQDRPDEMLNILMNAYQSEQGDSTIQSCIMSWQMLCDRGIDRAAMPETTTNASDQETVEDVIQSHPTSQRWMQIGTRMHRILRAYDGAHEFGSHLPVNLDVLEWEFEKLLDEIDENLRESEAILKRMYPQAMFAATEASAAGKKIDVQVSEGETPDVNLVVTEANVDVDKLLPLLFAKKVQDRYGKDLRDTSLFYHHAVRTLRRQVEAAYLGLYDNGRTIRLMPVISRQTFGGDRAGVQPWGTAQMLLYSGDHFVRRFFDPQYRIDERAAKPEFAALKLNIPEPVFLTSEEPAAGAEDAAAETTAAGEDAGLTAVENVDDDEEEMSEEQRFFHELYFQRPQRDQTLGSASSASEIRRTSVDLIRDNFRRLLIDFRAGGRDRISVEFRKSALRFQDSLQTLAGIVEGQRLHLIDSDNAGNQAQWEAFDKTRYPSPDAMLMEYRYFRWSPLFWMCVFAAVSIALTATSLLVSFVRREMIESMPILASGGEDDTDHQTVKRTQEVEAVRKPLSLPEESVLWAGILMLLLAVGVTFLGGLMRAWISGWAPVTNMFETIVLMAFSVGLFGLWYVLSPLLLPVMQIAWRYSAFPSREDLRERFAPVKTEIVPEENESEGEAAMRQAAEDFGLPGGRPIGMGSAISGMTSGVEALETDKTGSSRKSQVFWQVFFSLPRMILMILTFVGVVHIAYGEYAHEHGVFAAAAQMLSSQDWIDWIVVLASIAMIVWFLPHMILATLIALPLLFSPNRVASELGIHTERVADETASRPSARSEMSSVFQGEHGGMNAPVNTSGKTWLAQVRAEILQRKAFLLIASVIILLTGFILFRNSEQFNPNIRPIVAVLRSNFWLTVHVFAIIIGYAAAIIAWGMALVSLGGVIFGHYPKETLPNGKERIHLPRFSMLFLPGVKRMILIALVLLVLGTILGARWADYSWGRFWGWDPKEVWALITILFFAIVLHGRIGRLYGRIGLLIGALLGSLAVICTWYVVSFKFRSIHAYGGGDDSRIITIFLWCFVFFNILWGAAALLRYFTCVYDREEEIV